MTERIVAPELLRLSASAVDWRVQAKEWLGLATDPASRKRFEEIMQSTAAPTIQLRWMLNSVMGLTRTPFRVYLRRGGANLARIPFSPTTIVSVFPRRIDLPAPMAIVELFVGLNLGTALEITAYSLQGKPVAVGTATIPGTQRLFLTASNATYLIARGDGIITAIEAITAADFAALPDWKLVEKVGFPLIPAEYPGTNYNSELQGLVASPVQAIDAAMRRLTVGQPLLGWAPTTNGGLAVTPWTGPDLKTFLKEARDGVLSRVLDLFHHVSDPFADAAYITSEPLQPPAQQGGSVMDPTVSNAQVPVIALCLLAAGGDPFNSLALGFGTAFASEDLPAAAAPPPLDAMVVAEYGFAGTPIEIADFAIGIGLGTPPGDPADVAATLHTLNRPHVVDGPFTASFDTSWLRPQPLLDTMPRSASYAVLRAAVPSPTELLLRKRVSGGWVPFVPARAPQSDETSPIVFNDGDVEPPGNPTNAYTYGVAGQDLFGRWTHWIDADVPFPAEPPLTPSIAEAKLDVQGTGPNPCPAILTLDFSWDWTDRRPLKITFAGTLYRPPDATSPLPTLAPGTGMQFTLGGAVGAPVEVDFDLAGTPSVTASSGASIAERPTPAAAPPLHDVRSYRLTLPGFALDFAGKSEMVLFVWATGFERVAPANPMLNANPRIVHAASPIPPGAPVTPDHIVWTGLPDHAGVSRAHLTWSGTGPHYVVYEATETALRASAGMQSADLTEPIPARNAVLRGLDLGVHRQAFRRVTTRPIDAAEYEAELPRGSRIIHAFVVTAVDDNNIESDWPTAGTAFIACATPAVQVPKPPRLRVDVVPSGTGKAAKVTVETRSGVPVAFVELYRTSNEASSRSVNLMGPPISRSDAASGWSVQTDAAGAVISATFIDTGAPPSWDPMWYRAIAWSADDLVNGFYAARSDSSSSLAVIVPPSTPPTLSNLIVRAPGSTADHVLVTFQSDAPIGPTALGSHVLTISVRDPDKPPSESRTFRRDVPLESLRGFATFADAPDATSAPGTTFRILVATPPVTYGTWIPRPTRTPPATDTFDVAVSLRDPLGRIAQTSGSVNWT